MNAVADRPGRALVHPGGGESSRAIFGIRGVAALALLTVHVAMFSGLLGTKAFGTFRPPTNFVGAFFVSGLPSFIGVFFVLPALFLYLPLAKAVIAGGTPPRAGGVLLRRVARLLPAYYVMYLVVLLALNRHAIDGVWYVLRPILLLQVYLPSPFVPTLMNGMEITWTVPSMIQWYAALPLILWATHRFAARGATPAQRARRLMLPVPLLIAVGIGWLFFVKANGWDNRIVFWWPQGFAPTIAIGMALAIRLALVQVSPGDRSGILAAAARHPNRFWFAAAVVYLVNCFRPFSVIGMDAIYSVSGLLVTYLMVALFGLFASLPLIAPGTRRHTIGTLLGTAPLAYLGRVSYGIYLWHFAVMHFYLQPERVFDGPAKPIRELYGSSGFWRLELVTVLGAVLLAALSYHLLEQPVADRVKRHLARRRDRDGTPGRVAALVAAPAAPPAGPTAVDDIPPVTDLLTQRDVIRANLVDLEGSAGPLLTQASLTGRTADRWTTASVDLAELWKLFDAYSRVVDAAVQIASDRQPVEQRMARVTALLAAPSVVVSATPPPLDQRHITDDGRQRLAVEAAVARMNDLFARCAALTSMAEAVWREGARRLVAFEAQLAALDQSAAPSAEVARAMAEAEAELSRLRVVLGTDPLSLWRDGQLDEAQWDRLRRSLAAAGAGAATD
ncbi:acyltransferase [Micromonospora sp. WMMD1082]|uniref:acyltransferase family protein n=1 Tax=Micromonospora sp. WMMD1082 TaxID=3016104 RepID=UPI0024171159|nr:acyltransferase [Micromonospora sp. WMMD1082]MDG4792778.1 acyltransferase [Micromonospora sp. WMMD1082]